jgi:hypothetical protein
MNAHSILAQCRGVVGRCHVWNLVLLPAFGALWLCLLFLLSSGAGGSGHE